MSLLSVESIIWEKCIKEKKCVKIGWPINKEYCISITACIRLIKVNNDVVLELQAFGKSFRYALTSACHIFFSAGIATFKICISPNNNGNGVKIAVEGCIGVDGIEECWTLFAAYPKWFLLQEASEEELYSMDIDPTHLSSLTNNGKDGAYGTIESDLNFDDIQKLLSYKAIS